PRPPPISTLFPYTTLFRSLMLIAHRLDGSNLRHPDFSLGPLDFLTPLLALIPLRHTNRQALVAVRILLFHRLIAHASLDELILGLVLPRRRNRHRPHLPAHPSWVECLGGGSARSEERRV